MPSTAPRRRSSWIVCAPCANGASGSACRRRAGRCALRGKIQRRSEELDHLLDWLPAWTLVGGKGGVGKTTCATALAIRSAARGHSTLLLSTDPAGTLGDMVGVPLGGQPTPVPDRPGLSAMQLDASAAREAFLARWRATLVTIL